MPAADKSDLKWYLRPWVVIILLFLVLGPFGLPLVYKSPAFNRGWKVVLTLLTLIYTAYLVFATVKAVQIVASSFSAIRKLGLL